MPTAKILHKSDTRLLAILAARTEDNNGCLIHSIKTISYKGGVHALAKLSFALANRMTLAEINESGQWVKRTCKNELCTNARHLELTGKGAKKLTGEEKIERQLEKDEKRIFEEFSKDSKILVEEEEERKELTEEELEEESNRIMQELAEESEEKEKESTKELPELNW